MVSTLGQALDQIGRLKAIQGDFTLLSTQLSSGKKTQKFSGLGADVLISKRSRAQFTSLETYQTNILNGERRIQQTLTALQEFRAQTENFQNYLFNFSQESLHQEGDVITRDDPATPNDIEFDQIGYNSADPDADLENLQAFAHDIFDFMTDLVNRQDEDRYLFGGADSLNKPLNVTGTLDAAISTALTNWKDEASASNITTDQLIADLTDRVATTGNPDAINDSIVGYNSTLTSGNSGKVFVRINETSEVDYTSLGTNQGMRDVLVAVSYFKNENLTPAGNVYAEPYNFGDPPIVDGAPGDTVQEQKENFFEVFNALTKMVSDALGEIDKDIRKLETARIRLDEAKRSNQDQQNLALNYISDVEDVDIDEVAIKLNSLQITLDASYRVTARLQELSLVNFI